MSAAAEGCSYLRVGCAGYPAPLGERLGAEAPATLACRGPAELLSGPLLALFGSTRAPAHLALWTYDLARRLRMAGTPVVGGFQSPLEREALAFLLRGTRPVVVSPARGIERLRLPHPWRQPLADGRLLLVSRFEDRHRRPDGRMAEERNRLVAALADTVFVAHAEPGGRAYRVAAQALRWGTPVLTFDDPANSDLLLLGARPVDPTAPAL